MKKTNSLILLTLTLVLLTSCNSTNNRVNNQSNKDNSNTIIDKDSVELTTLVRKVYSWHITQHITDFPYKYEKPGDTIFIGIDWDAYDKYIETLKKTNNFTDDFIIFHKIIASNLDSSIKKADIKWRNINYGIPLWNTGADDWCGCQDYPDNYWDSLTLDSIQIVKDFAKFNWTWDKGPSDYPHQYKITAKKIGDSWKINSLEGFKYYGNVDYYDKIMKEEL